MIPAKISYDPSNAAASIQLPVDVALDAIRGPLAGTRLALVKMAFSRLRGSGDAPGETVAAAADVASQFDPTGHPEVIAGRRSPEVKHT